MNLEQPVDSRDADNLDTRNDATAAADEIAPAEASQTVPVLTEEESGAGSGTSKRRHRSHRHRRSKHGSAHWSERSKLLGGVLAVIIVFSCCALLFMTIRIHNLNKLIMNLKKENIEIQENLVKNRGELDLARGETEKLQQNIQSLLKSQLPGLINIQYNQIITLNNGYLVNIVFNKVNNKTTRGYEFRILIKNETLATIWPKIKMSFFDKSGIQMNSIEIGVGKDALMKIDTLNPAEERSDSSPVIKLLDNEELPVYFMIKLLT